MSFFISTRTLFPSYQYSKEKVIDYYNTWISSKDKRYKQKANAIFENTVSDLKNTVVVAEELFETRSFEVSNNTYCEKAIELGVIILKQALEDAKIDPKDLDAIITTSCTGYMIPSFDAYLVDQLKLRLDVKRLPITELGCAAGVAGLMYAHDLIRAGDVKKMAVISLELPSNTIQLDDYSWGNVISTALFSDGVACTLLSSEKQGKQLVIIDAGMIQVPESTDILQYKLTNTGLRMHLDKAVPQVINDFFESMVSSFLERSNLRIKDIHNYLIHPGGFKIINNIQKILGVYQKNVSLSHDIMRKYGNMSSSTIFFILEEYLKKHYETGEYVLLMSFGPGFSAYFTLAQWQ